MTHSVTINSNTVTIFRFCDVVTLLYIFLITYMCMYLFLSLSLSLSPSLSPETAPLPVSILKQTEWLRAMLFNRSSCSARTMAYGILLSLCKGDERRRQILVLLSRYSACTYVYLYSSLSPPPPLSLSLSLSLQFS